MHDLALIDRALALIARFGAPDALPDVRALRARLDELKASESVAAESADELHERLVQELAAGTTTVERAGEQLADLARQREVHESATEPLVDQARERVFAHLHDAAVAVGDGWIVALRPAVDRLAEALGKATKLTDGALEDVAAGNGTPAQRALVEAVATSLPDATAAQDLAAELRAAGLVSTNALEAPVIYYETAMRWVDVTPVEEEARERRYRTDRGPRLVYDLGQPGPLIRFVRDRGAVPALLTAEQVKDRPSEGARWLVDQAERRAREISARRRDEQKIAEAEAMRVRMQSA